MSILGNLFGADKLQAEGDALDAKLTALNAKDYAPGGKLYSPANWAAVQQNLDTGRTGDVDAQINAAFKEGLDDGANNVTGFLGGIFDFVGKGLGAILKAVPWWVWLGVITYFLFTTGIAQRLLARVGSK
jgi:hypothetical protein